MILSEFIPNHQLGKSEISHCVEQTWNNLLFRTGDSTLRLRTLAVTFIRVSADFKNTLFVFCKEVTPAAIQVIGCQLKGKIPLEESSPMSKSGYCLKECHTLVAL